MSSPCCQAGEASMIGVVSALARSSAASAFREGLPIIVLGSAGRISISSKRSCFPTRPFRKVINFGVEGRGVELGMAEHCLDNADIDAVLEQMRRKTVP